MKIAIILLNRGRGSGEVARQHARHLIKNGHEIIFLHPGNRQSVINAENINIELHSPVTPVHEFLPGGDNQKQVARMAYEEAEAYIPDYVNAVLQHAADADILIGHHANLSAVATHRAAEKIGKPFVVFVHGTGIEPRHEGLYDDRLWTEIEKALSAADGIMVTTEYVKDELVQPLLSLPENKFLILPCGVDLQEFHPENVNGIREKYHLPEKYVICPGALTASKGPQNVVKAARYFSDTAQIIFIGDGELRSQLEHKLGSRGRFLGFVPAEDKAQLINAATLLTAAPEKKEHFGIIYAEALAAGTPPVAYSGGGVGSIIAGGSGILTERDPDILGTAILALLQNPDEISEMGRRARNRAERYYDYNNLIPMLEQWLQEKILTT